MQVEATSGERFQGGIPHATRAAGIESAAHDLGCPRDRIALVVNEEDNDFTGGSGTVITLAGCDQLVTYKKIWSEQGCGGSTCHFGMISRSRTNGSQ